MTKDDITDLLTLEIERMLADNARLEEEKRQDVGIWLKAETDYQATIRIFRAENAELKSRLKVLITPSGAGPSRTGG